MLNQLEHPNIEAIFWKYTGKFYKQTRHSNTLKKWQVYYGTLKKISYMFRQNS